MAAPMPRLPPVTITIPVAAVAAPFLFRISYARSRYVNLRYLLPTFCGLDSKPDRVERWKKYQGQEGSHCRSADQCIGERSPKCREREWDEGQDRGQCRQHNRSRTLDCCLHQSVERIEAVIAICLDLSYQNECVPHQDSGERDQAKDGIEAERLMEDQKDGDDSHQAQRRRQDGHGQG